jgi:hypothetical protein
MRRLPGSARTDRCADQGQAEPHHRADRALGDGRGLLAGRRPLLRPHPMDETCLGVADAPADGDIGRAVAAHSCLGQPGKADLKSGGHLPRGQEVHCRGRGLMRGRAAGERRLRRHFQLVPLPTRRMRDGKSY